MNPRTVLSGVLAFIVVSGLAWSAAPESDAGAKRQIVVFQDSVVNLPAQDALVKAVGGVVVKPLRLINGMAVMLPAPAVAALARRAEVKRVDEDLVISATDSAASAAPAPPVTASKGKPTPTPTPTPPPVPPQEVPWGVVRVGAPYAWTYSTGSWVKVAVLDTGVQLNHPDLQGNVAGGVNTINSAKSADDDNGHGTHVAGIVAAINNTRGVVGVAPAAKIYAVKALDRNGRGWLSDLIEGLNWCIDNHMQVVNMSLGATSDNQSFHEAITKVFQSGITQVAAAGNESSGQVNFPAGYEEVICVTASDIGDQFASFSNYGSAVDLIAPGVAIESTYKGGAYRELSGTSMATPHVTAIAALRLQLHPSEGPAAIKSVLQGNTVSLGLPPEKQGAGLPLAILVVTAP